MNYIEIYKGKTISNGNLINGVDMDSFSLTTNLDETFDVGTFNIVSNTNNAKQLTSRDYITIVEYEENPINDNGYTIVHQEQYIVDVVGETVIRKVGNSLLYEYQVTFYEKTAELQNVLTPNLSTTQPLPDLWMGYDDDEPTETTRLNVSSKRKDVEIVNIEEQWRKNITYGVMYWGNDVPWVEDYALWNHKHNHPKFPYEQFANIPNKFVAGANTGNVVFTLPTELKVWWYTESIHSYYYEILDEDGTSVYFGTQYQNPTYTFTNITETKTYTINTYMIDYRPYTEASVKTTATLISWQIILFPNETSARDIASKYHTTYEVIDKLVKTIKPYKNLANTRYKIGDSCAYLNYKVCPDLFLTNNNLFENLLLIGRTCNSIPYLDDNDYIQMLDLGKHDDAPSGLLDTYNGYTRITNYDGKVGACISDLQNMIPSNTLGNGTCEDSWRTLEVDGGTQFTPDACYYRSDFPMYSLKKMEVKIWASDGTYRDIYDITDYMYESCVYNTLDTTSGSLNSILTALSWEQYGNKITGFQGQVATTLGTSDGNAIATIIHRVCPEESVASLLQDWNERLMFKATYVPVINARVKQYRPDATSINGDEIIINQQTNLGSLETTGDSMKNSLLMLGNDTISQKKFVSSWSDVPEINQQVSISNQKWIITQVVRAFSNKGYDLAITYSKNFNRLSANQSLATERRWADVPLTNAINRTINLDDYLILSPTISKSGIPATNETNVFYVDERYGGQTSMIKYMFGGTGADRKRFKEFRFFLSSDKVNSYGTSHFTCYPNHKTCPNFVSVADESKNCWITLPITTGAFGNSIFLKANTRDNYSAKMGIIDVEVGDNDYKFCQDVPYSSELGEGQYLDFMFTRDATNTTGDNAWNTNNIIVKTNDKSLWHSTPTYCSQTWGNIANRVYIEKDSREQLDIVYQMHFVSTSNDLFIGRAFSEMNPMICDLNLTNNAEYVGVIIKGKYDATRTSIESEDLITSFTPVLEFGGSATDCIKTPNIPPMPAEFTTEDVYIGLALKYKINSVVGIVNKFEILVARNLHQSRALNNQVICYATLRSDLPKM